LVAGEQPTLVEQREREFWDEQVPDLAACERDYDQLYTGNAKLMLDAVAPWEGRRFLDFACGTGVLATWLAVHGAEVVGVDLSPRSIERGRELAARFGASPVLTTDPLEFLPASSFDAVVGRYALHHVDLDLIGPLIRRALKPGAVGAFVETMALNPALNVARSRLSGRLGVQRYGSSDERPLDTADLERLRSVFGEVSLATGRMEFLRIFDRNVLRYQHPPASGLIGGVDDWLLRRGLGRLSYHQVVVLRRRG
jgi:SAM-dependent methyltransferase